jgi:predicted transcriptional regulator
MVLAADTAAELMTPNPLSIRQDATVKEAAGLLVSKGISGAPVINDAGVPVGIVSNSDILIHHRERMAATATGETDAAADSDQTRVRDIMTPIIFSVAPDYPARKVIAEMVALKVRRVFVVEHPGVLVGVISTVDVLRHLQ